MHKPTLLAFAWLCASSVIACSVLSDDASSQEQDHTEGQPTYAQYKWLWADDTLDEFKKNASAGSWWGAPEYLGTDHPMAQRLQFWVDQMDAMLRAKMPKALENTPKPQIVIRKDSDPNAWVSGLPVAWKVPTRVTRAATTTPPPEVEPPPAPDAADGGAGDPGDAGAEAAAPPAPPPPPAATFLLSREGKLSVPYETTPFERPHDERSLSELVAFGNDGFAKCRLSLERETLVFGEGCVLDASLTGERAESIAYYATSKWVTVTTGLIMSLMDEERIVGVLAHELGHYYRVHVMQPSDQLNYFYGLGDANVPTKPAPDPRYLEQTLKVRQKLREGGWFIDFTEENKLMVDQRLGFYTSEQEADDLALELLTKTGLPPTLAADSMAALHKAIDDMGGAGDTGEIKWEQCAVLRDRGFKDDTGAWVPVPVGNLTSAHHSFCFRIFNMVRELAAHRYAVAEGRPRPQGEAWFKLVQRLSNDIDPPPPPPLAPDAGGEDAAAADGGPGDAGTD